MYQQQKKTRISTHIALAAMTAFGSAPAFADPSPALDRVSIWLGAFYSDTQTQLGATGRSGVLNGYSGHFSLEDDLGFQQHKAVPRAKLDFLIGDHQGFSFDFFGLDRTRSKSISRDIDFDGTDFPASARVDGKLNFNFGSAAYRYWFGSGSDVFGLGIGAAYYGVKARIAGEADVDGYTGQAQASTHETAWAPVLQMGWRHAFSHNLRMYADAYGVKKWQPGRPHLQRGARHGVVSHRKPRRGRRVQLYAHSARPESPFLSGQPRPEDAGSVVVRTAALLNGSLRDEHGASV
ncbi:hypothetical protein [Dyella sp. C11]|uniref:hypothetical protein n=1 Tax=Dyella sp. C11 TaxID=2126991 RepID=UPI001E3A1ED8|nr:hypothetical protein [Dyella sp. C11]